jgi:NhaA family Na+:H+ antiporter
MIPRALRVPWFVLNSLFVLPLGCVVALAWATAFPEAYYRISHALDFAINDVAIAFFFGLMTKHVVEETLAGGSLHSWRRALLPIVAAVGGTAVPVAIYLLVLGAVGEPMLVSAWVVTAAVDVAAAFLVGDLIFGRHAALPFLVLLALASNAIGFAIIAIHIHTSLPSALLGLGVFVVGTSLALWLRRRPTASYWPYLLGPGVLCWAGLYWAGVHPALALVAVVPFMPHARRDPGLLADPIPGGRDTLTRFERAFGPPVQVVLFLFGLVNAGIPLHGLEAGMWAFPIAVLVGRPIGVLVATELGVVSGLHRIAHVGGRELLVIGLVTSTGLSMALFFATAVMSTGPLLMQLKSGALLSVVGALLALLTARALHIGRFQPDSPERPHQ